MLIASVPAVAYGQTYCKRLEREKIRALIINEGNYDKWMTIDNKSREDLEWWKKNISVGINPIRVFRFTLDISSDALLSEWGSHCKGVSGSGLWNSTERKRHINYLELLVAFFALKSFASSYSNYEILLRLDDTTAIAYINKAGFNIHFSAT